VADRAGEEALVGVVTHGPHIVVGDAGGEADHGKSGGGHLVGKEGRLAGAKGSGSTYCLLRLHPPFI